jgi:hypothetical protein
LVVSRDRLTVENNRTKCRIGLRKIENMTSIPFIKQSSPRADIAKQLPANIEAESYVLSAALCDGSIPNQVLESARRIVSPDDFFGEHTRRIFRSMLALQEAQQPIEIWPLFEKLKLNGDLEAAGGTSFLGELLREGIRTANVGYYCNSIKEKALMRSVIHLTERIQKRVFDSPVGAETILAEAIEELSTLATSKTENPSVVVGARELLDLDLPNPDWLMEPLITRAGTSMLYSYSGFGKSWIATEIAFRVAGGIPSIFDGHLGPGGHWPINGPVRTLYLYGEMHGAKIRERLAGIAKGNAGRMPENEFLGVMSKDYQTIPRAARAAHSWRPSICSPKDRRYIEERIFGEGYQFVVLDNISTLWSVAQEDQSRQVAVLKDWFINLNTQGITVLVLQHAGKSGDYLGDSAQIHILDSVLKLVRPSDHKKSEGLRVILEIQKNRYECRDTRWLVPFEATLHLTPEDGARWLTKSARDAQLIAAFQAFADGMPTIHVAQEVGVSKATIYRWRKNFGTNSDPKYWIKDSDE